MPDEDRCEWPGCDRKVIWGAAKILGKWKRYCQTHGMKLAQADNPDVMEECVRRAMDDLGETS